MNAQTERTTYTSTKVQVGAPHHYQRLVYTNERADWEDDMHIYQGPGGSTTSLSALGVH